MSLNSSAELGEPLRAEEGEAALPAAASGQCGLSRRIGMTAGVSCLFKWPTRRLLQVYAHFQRHDVEKRRPAPLIR